MTSIRPPKRPLKFFAFGNLAVGFIAVGNVAVGVVAVGLSVAVGPIAIGINSLGVLVAIGVNGVATVALAAVNGMGVVSLTGVNALGTFAASFVNTVESIFFAPALLAVQLAVAYALRGDGEEPAPGSPMEVKPQVPTRLARLVTGAIQTGPVHVRIRKVGSDEISVVDDEDAESTASLALSGPARADLAALSSRAVEGGAPVLVEVRATTELLPPSADADYRSAPEQRRQLWAERVLALPEPPPFWEKPGALRQITRASLLAGAAMSAAGLAARLFLAF